MSRIFRLFKGRPTTASQPAPADTVRFHLTDIKADPYRDSHYGCERYSFGNRYTAFVKGDHYASNGARTIRIRDNVDGVSATVKSTAKGYIAFAGESRDVSAHSLLKKYRLPNATGEKLQRYPLLDDDFLIGLIKESRRSEPEVWAKASAASRKTRLDNIRGWAVGGGVAWGAVFVLLTLFTWLLQIPVK